MVDIDEVIRLAKKVVAGEMTHEAARSELRSLPDRSRRTRMLRAPAACDRIPAAPPVTHQRV